MHRLRANLPKIYIYNDLASRSLDIAEIASYLRSLIPSIKVEVRGDFFQEHMSQGDEKYIAERLASIRVRDIYTGSLNEDPLAFEISYELGTLRRNPVHKPLGIMYDGYELMTICQELLRPAEKDYDNFHVIFTSRFFGTKDPGDGRVHGRVIICGNPTLISTSGIVEAPAKPREYYFYINSSSSPDMQALLIEEAKQRLRGRFIDYDDERLTGVLKGYVLQGLYYYLFGEQFCENKDCRLYNAHWQEEVIRAQLNGEEPRLCLKHRSMLSLIQNP